MEGATYQNNYIIALPGKKTYTRSESDFSWTCKTVGKWNAANTTTRHVAKARDKVTMDNLSYLDDENPSYLNREEIPKDYFPSLARLALSSSTAPSILRS